MVVLLFGVRSEEPVWLVREVRPVLRRLLGVGSKTKNWVDYNTTLQDALIVFARRCMASVVIRPGLPPK